VAVKRILAGGLLLAMAAAVAYGYTATRREHAYRVYLAQGDAALARDNTFAAIEAFSGAIAVKSNSMLGYLKRGEVYRRRGEFDSALRDLLRASDLDPTAPRPLELLGDTNYAIRRYAKAAERYRAYVQIDDRSPRVLYKLALAQYNLGQTTPAIEALQQAVALDDRFAEAYYLLGLCLRDAQKLDAARAALQKSIALEPAMLHPREELADLDRALGRTDDQLAQLVALSALDATPSRQVTLGLAYAAAGQWDRAILTLGDAAKRYPDHAYAYVALGRVWLERAQLRGDRVDLSKALGALEEAIGSDESSEALTLFGRALLLTSDEESAERMLLDATQREPADPLAFYYLADAAERLGHYDVARRALLQYQALKGTDADPRRRAVRSTRLGDLSLHLNEPAVAVAYYRAALEDAGADVPLLTRLADAEWRAGDRDGARVTVAKALDKEPRNTQALALRHRLGR
jgi:tetratricopeptide (TPR) repeat protein